MSITRRSFVVGILASLVIFWLAISKSAPQRRRETINAAIQQGEIARLPQLIQRRLEDQVAWLSKHAGAGNTTNVNGLIASGMLNVIVTRPEFENLTRCGSGNAIYDPTLDTIFLDESLVVPYEFTVLGENSVYSMVSAESLGFAVSYLNFIIAHELGHRQRGEQAAAFFHYGYHEGSAVDIEEETEADRFAITTMIAAYRAGDVPETIAELNARGQVGLDSINLTPDEAAMADVLGAMKTMSTALLFSSSPYSPYFSDVSHPDFIRRASEAIDHAGVSESAQVLRSHNAVVQEELARFRGLAWWPHREVMFPAPVHTLEVRGELLWIGCIDLPHPTELMEQSEPVTIQEQLFKIALSDLDDTGSSTVSPEDFVRVVVGRSPDSGLPGDWVEALFRDGSSGVGMLPPGRESDAERVGTFVEGDEYAGVVYAGDAWRWHDPNRGIVYLPESVINAHALRRGDTYREIGAMQAVDSAMSLPVLVSRNGSSSTFHVLSVHNSAPEPLRDTPLFFISDVATAGGHDILSIPDAAIVGVSAIGEDTRFSFTPPEGTVKIEGARYWKDAWWVPVRVNSKDRDDWQVWKVETTGEAKLAASGRLLSSLAGSGATGVYRQDLDPWSMISFVVDGGPLLFGFIPDSVYAIDPDRNLNKVIFHPAVKGLEIVDLGDGQIMFWVRYGRKAFVLDTTIRKEPR